MMVVSHDWSLHLIRKAGALPEQQIAASLIVTAREGCAAGDDDDCRWLRSCALAYLALVIPPETDEHVVLARLMADLPVADDVEEGWHADSQQFIQMLLSIPLEQEASHGNGDRLPQVRAPTRALARGDPLRYMETAPLPGV
jgi:hypothetical protein